MSEWINVKDKLPEEPKKYCDITYDIWSLSYRITDVKFEGGLFKESILDSDRDFSHYEIIYDVTHWMHEPKPPTGEE